MKRERGMGGVGNYRVMGVLFRLSFTVSFVSAPVSLLAVFLLIRLYIYIHFTSLLHFTLLPLFLLITQP